MLTLLLFDVDGTLILTGGAGVRGMNRAFESIFAVPRAFDGIPMPGRTDPVILADALARHGIEANAADILQFRARYRQDLADEMRTASVDGARVMPGVRDLLATLRARSDVFLALLTGNYSEAARIKLETLGLWSCFECGAFGEDAADRNGLVSVAIERALHCGMPRGVPRRVCVVGDTPLDVACALAAGVRSIAVTTGGYSAATLRASGAEAVLEDLSDAQAFLRLIDEDAPDGKYTRSPAPA